MNYLDYLKKKAAPWVSASVLVGGLVSALILFWIMKIESEIQATSLTSL